MLKARPQAPKIKQTLPLLKPKIAPLIKRKAQASSLANGNVIDNLRRLIISNSLIILRQLGPLANLQDNKQHDLSRGIDMTPFPVDLINNFIMLDYNPKLM